MKKICLVLFVVFNMNLVVSDEIVNIWADHSMDLYGVSQDRVWLKSYFLSNFEYYTTLNTESNRGVLTAVTVSRELFFLLNDLLKFEDSYQVGDKIITKNGDIYRFKDDSYQLDISFSLEKPGTQIFDTINKVYENDRKTRDEVTAHYQETWVVRIHRAENVSSPDLNSLEFDDVLISATIVGESFQWLWGIHDGVDYIYKVLK